VAERKALAAAVPGCPEETYRKAQKRVQHLQRQLDALDNCDGGGVLRGTPVGDAAMARSRAIDEWGRCLALAENAGLRERHQLRRQAARAAKREGPLRDAFDTVAAPERHRILAELPEARKQLAELGARRDAHEQFHGAHPEALRRLLRLDSEIKDGAYELDVEREPLDGIAPHRPEVKQWLRAPERDVPELERGIELEIGL